MYSKSTARFVRRSAAVCALVGSVCAGFVACNREPPPAESGPTLVLDALPSGVRPRGNEFDGKVAVVGYKIAQRSMRAGNPVNVTLYWRASAPLEPGYRMVTQLVDDAGERVLDLDNAGPLRDQKDGKQILAPETWVPGKIYVDELSFTVPRNVRTARVQLVTGFVKGEEKLKISSGNELDGMALIATSGTGVRVRDTSKRARELRIDKLDAATKIKIDGKLDEQAWKDAPPASLADGASGRVNKRSPLSGEARLLWNEQGLYFAFDLKETDVIGGFKPKDKDPHVWTKSGVEIVLDPEGDNKDFYDIQVNPQNLVYDTQYDAQNEPRKEPDGPFGHEEWSSGVKSAVSIEGTLDKSDDKDQGYVVEAFVPWKSFAKFGGKPPTLGAKWRVNLYARREGTTLAWSPVIKYESIHESARFGELMFAQAGFVEAPAADSSAAPVASGAAPPVAGSAAPVAVASSSAHPLVEHLQSAKTKPEAQPKPPAPAPVPSAK